MRSPFALLILASSLAALPVTGAARPVEPASVLQEATAATGAGATKVTPAKKGKRPAKPATAAKPAAAKKVTPAKDAGKADCDTPAPKVAATKPPPVPADPFAPIVAPCADPKP